MITTHTLNVARHELIGLAASIVAATNPRLVGTTGIVVDETKHFVTIDTSRGRKRVPKRACTFRFGGVDIEGRDIEVAPEERIKLKVNHGRS
ncbi:ribonuclease P protein subunit [Candidatus Woesearchaeota archaeon]|nr:ribonuclease P protein subunit [Candidatus Woesearchaeota archaeon]